MQESHPTFAEAQPAELAEWDYEHNDAEGFYPHKVTLGSAKQVHWICSCCPRGQPHRWTAAPYARIGLGTGCAVCAGRQACVCNSLESLFPSVAADLDVDKNGFAASEVTAHTQKEVWWRTAKRGGWKQVVNHRTFYKLSPGKPEQQAAHTLAALSHATLCRKGQLRCQVTAVKPDLPGCAPPASPDISMLSPELQQQWHLSANMHLGAVKVRPKSAIKAVWQCNKCPAGQPHVWTAVVANRPQSAPGPYCSNKRVCLHNSLATVAPDVAQYWNYSKNEQAPEQMLSGSRLRAEWKCPACKYEWKAPVHLRTHRKAGCPKCSTKHRNQQPQPTFAEAQPAELPQWDHERNEAEGFYPHKITLGSRKLVHWICSCCPRGQPHRWTAPPRNRVGYGEGCAVCAGQQACSCNSLESLVPSVAAELDVEENGFSASEVTAGSSKEVWWRNAKRGSWRQPVCERTMHRLKLHKPQGGE
ncbi:hypothetical protein ABBQ38_001901 [Trebouxia sp. C0009 RCD-2024]